jgi:chromosome segregation ATPase
MLEATENVFVSLSFLRRPLFLSQDILNQLDNIRTQLKTQLNEMETKLEETEKRERKEQELKLAAMEDYNSTASRVEETDIAKLKEEIKQKAQQLKHLRKRMQDECARRDEIISNLHEVVQELKEAFETGHATKDDMLDTAERVIEHFAECEVMYNDLMKQMMAVQKGPEKCMKHRFEE